MSVRQMVADVVGQFRQELTRLVTTAVEDGLDADGFVDLIEDLKSVLNSAGRRTLVKVVHTQDEIEGVFEHEGNAHRFKQVSTKEWLSPFGRIAIGRRYYQPDEGGEGVAPIDLRCGMVGRYLTPDLEEATAFAAAELSPKQTRELLAKLLPEAPSEKAIRRTIEDVGNFAEETWEEIESRVEAEAELPEGDVLVVSVDGVTVPLREAGTKPGRPADRPGVREGNHSPTAWKEAGVGTISVYEDSLDEAGEPERLATRYFARMPEPGMERLFDQQSQAVERLIEKRDFREVVVLCDGKRSLWNTIERTEPYEGATQILDFFHVSEHLSHAAEAIFGKRDRQAASWHAKYRARLLEDPDGPQAVIRSLRYYRAKLRRGTERHGVIRRVIGYLTRNKSRVTYAEFRRRGLPIGSGPVEAACKTIVSARLKRSGMRWSRTGGQRVMNLRTRKLSGEWSALWNEYQQQRKPAA